MKKRRQLAKGTAVPHLKSISDIRVRFNEVDSLRAVWHGHYIRYFEDGREGFGKEFGLGYLTVYEHGFAIPIVKAVCDYKKMLRYGDEAYIETQFMDCPAAKIIFQYKIFRKSDDALIATGETVQVFVTDEGELILNLPDFFLEWKRKHGILK